MSPDELGVDSLVAVEIRSWFLRELGLDVPVLKIFNVASIQELIEFAFSILPTSVIPNIETGTPMPKQLSEEVGVESKEMISASSGENSQYIQKSIPEDDKSFQIHYPLKTETESVVSVDSVLTGDSSSSQNGDRDSSSSSSVEFEESMEEKRKIQRVAPMSMAQTGFWFLSNFVKQKTAFNVTPKFELTGKLRLDDFEKAVRDVVQHHQAIRTFFFVDDDQVPMQGVWNTSHLDFEHKIITHETEADATAHEMAAHIFNLAQGEPIQIKILSLGSDRHWLIFAFHHIIMDGMSFEIFWSDLETAYSGKPLAPVLQYPDFARQQLQEYEAGEYEMESKYWKSQFESLPPPIPLLSFSLRPDRPEVVGFDSHTVQLKLEQSFSEEIDACCRRFKVTPFHFHLATWQIFLLRHLQLENICIGLGDGNRTHPDVMQTVGLFLNTLPLQFNTTPSQTFAETLKRTKTISQNAFANSRMPFDAILNELSVPRSASHNPLFQAFFNFRQSLEVSREFCGCKAEASLIAPGATSYDLQLDVSTLGPGDTSVYLLVQKDLYSATHAEILLRGYERLLRDFCRNPATRLSWSKIYSEADIEQSLKIGKGKYHLENSNFKLVFRSNNHQDRN